MKNLTLKSLNSFSINVQANNIITAYTEYELLSIFNAHLEKDIPVFLLGEGSNVLFLENFVGTILLNRIPGIIIKENSNYWSLHVGSGEIYNY